MCRVVQLHGQLWLKANIAEGFPAQMLSVVKTAAFLIERLMEWFEETAPTVPRIHNH